MVCRTAIITYTTLTDWFLYPRWSGFIAQYELCIQFTLDVIVTGLKFSEKFKLNEITQSAYIYGAQQKVNCDNPH